MEKKTKLLDSEWVQLLREARKAGLTVEEVRHFLKSRKKSSESPLWQEVILSNLSECAIISKGR